MRNLRLLLAVLASWSIAGAHAGDIAINYVPPKDPAHEPIYASLKQHQALEKLQQVFSPFQLPVTMQLRTIGCDGQPNAWYHMRTVSVCYEYLAEARKRVPDKGGPVRPEDALIGQFFYVFAHEFGHAVFDILAVPVFGRAEDAADQFAAYVMLQFNKQDAGRLVRGAVYTYKDVVTPGSGANSEMFKMYSDAHGTPEQRMYNLLCMAYGADADTFAGLVNQGYLPKQRASGCRREYGEVRYAFLKLISPHVDQAAAKMVMERTWLPHESEAVPAVSGAKANP